MTPSERERLGRAMWGLSRIKCNDCEVGRLHKNGVKKCYLKEALAILEGMIKP